MGQAGMGQTLFLAAYMWPELIHMATPKNKEAVKWTLNL